MYTPPAYAAEPERRFPTIYLIQGLTGMVEAWLNRKPFQRTVPELVDELFADPSAPPALVVYVDAFTAIGGSQFLDSPAIGRYHTYLCDEVVPFVDARFRTLPDAAHRGIAGKSSGGYGAMVTPMLRPDLFGGLATHAGDALFEHGYWPDVREAARALRDPVRRFVRGVLDRCPGAAGTPAPERRGAAQRLDDGRLLQRRPGRHRPAALRRRRPHPARRLGPMARVGPGPHGAPRTPTRCAGCAPSGSTPDGATSSTSTSARPPSSTSCAAVGITEPALRFELFDGTHANLEWRYPLALRFLAERLAGDQWRAPRSGFAALMRRRSMVDRSPSRGDRQRGPRREGRR